MPDSIAVAAEDRPLALRIERNWAQAAVDFTRRLHSLHSRWKGEVHALGHG